jgi:hypothetical protein
MTTHRPLAPVGRPLDQQRFDTQRDSLTSTSIYFDVDKPIVDDTDNEDEYCF